jgi:hypothetical protein
MATTTTNYGFDIPQSTDLVKDGATAIATLGQDIDTAMNTALGTKKAGMVLLNTTSFSGVSSQSINDVFSATYDNYLIQWNNCISVTSDTWLSIRMRVSGSDDSTANYHSEQLRGASATASAFRSTGATSWIETIFLHTAFADFGTLELSNPFATRITSGFSKSSADVNGSGIGVQNWSRGLNTATSYTGFSFFPATGGATMTGSVSVYGFNK